MTKRVFPIEESLDKDIMGEVDKCIDDAIEKEQRDREANTVTIFGTRVHIKGSRFVRKGRK